MQSRPISLSLSGNILTVLASGLILILASLILAKYISKAKNTETLNTKKNNVLYSKYGNMRPPAPYFAPDIYIVPGQAKLNHNVYTPDYLPYESAVPAIDVLRANKQIQLPNYTEQYLKHNTTPFSVRNN